MPKSSQAAPRSPEDIPPKLPPAKTRERRAQQMVMYAEDLLIERLRTGEASPTEVVAAVRLGTEIERANIERIKMHTQYLQAQKEKAESETVREEMFQKAMDAMSRYSGENRE